MVAMSDVFAVCLCIACLHLRTSNGQATVRFTVVALYVLRCQTKDLRYALYLPLIPDASRMHFSSFLCRVKGRNTIDHRREKAWNRGYFILHLTCTF